MSIAKEGNLIPFPDRSEFEETEETSAHPLGPAFAAFDQKFDLVWERFRGQPVLDKTFYLASELADFSVFFGTLWDCPKALPAAQLKVKPFVYLQP